jgi:acyl dehydratase
VTTVLRVDELESAGELDLGTSAWHRIEQAQIDGFADATGDHQWIHVDPERAAAGPFGTTIAHGFLTLSLLPQLAGEVLTVEGARLRINYGVERIRFTAPVPSGSEVRLHGRLLGAERRGDGILYRVGVQIEIRGAEKPACVGEVLSLVYP